MTQKNLKVSKGNTNPHEGDSPKKFIEMKNQAHIFPSYVISKIKQKHSYTKGADSHMKKFVRDLS